MTSSMLLPPTFAPQIREPSHEGVAAWAVRPVGIRVITLRFSASTTNIPPARTPATYARLYPGPKRRGGGATGRGSAPPGLADTARPLPLSRCGVKNLVVPLIGDPALVCLGREKIIIYSVT